MCATELGGGGTDLLICAEYILLLLSVILVINLAILVYRIKPLVSMKLASMAPASFFMYALHALLVINLVRESLSRIIPIGGALGRITVLLVTIPIVTLVVYLAYRVLNKWFPKVIAILSGGRG